MKITTVFIPAIIVFLFFPGKVSAQSVNELRKLTDEEWLAMSTDERLHSLQVSNNRARNQTFVGNFPRYTDLYPRWGYDYYEMEERYENYAFRGFENFNVIEDRRNKWYYNQFGDRLTKMTTDALIWREKYYDDGSYDAWLPGNYINAQLFQNPFPSNDIYKVKDIDGVWVARESTEDWAVSVVGSGSLRTILTPLTLNYPNLPGMKADFQSSNYQVSIVNSILAGKNSPAEGVSESKYSSLMLRGGQFRRKFGALTLGANYAAMYAVQSNRDEGNSWKGTVDDYAPTPMLYAVRIVDDSPQDGSGPIIHDVKLKVDGVYRPDILPQVILDDLRNDLRTAVTNLNEKKYANVPGYASGLSERWGGNAAPFTQTSLYERVPKYVDYLYMNDYINGWNLKTVTDNFDIELGKEYYRYIDPGGKPFQVNGNECVVYLFDLSCIKNKVKRVQAEITVANDYRIQLAEIFTKKTTGGHSAQGENFD